MGLHGGYMIQKTKFCPVPSIYKYIQVYTWAGRVTDLSPGHRNILSSVGIPSLGAWVLAIFPGEYSGKYSEQYP